MTKRILLIALCTIMVLAAGCKSKPSTEKMTPEEFKESLVKYMSAFVMPSDLSNCLPNEYWISNEKVYESAEKTV